MALSKTERLILMNQYRLLAILEPDQAESHEAVRDALESGYVAAYEQLFDYISDDLTKEECHFVVDALTVYEALQRAKSDDDSVAFPGFDGNNEAQHLGYLRYVVKKEGRFDYLKFAGRDFNSHMAMIPIYERMIAKHEEFGERLELRAHEVEAILEAMKHPR